MRLPEGAENPLTFDAKMLCRFGASKPTAPGGGLLTRRVDWTSHPGRVILTIKHSHMRTNPSVQQGVGGITRRAGFTIMELMAVVAIIVIVVGLLSVALNQTRNRTMRVMCLDNTLRRR
jgi:prepilin-type N-terminal cleavage/methylation domain-containing protein